MAMDMNDRDGDSVIDLGFNGVGERWWFLVVASSAGEIAVKVVCLW